MFVCCHRIWHMERYRYRRTRYHLIHRNGYPALGESTEVVCLDEADNATMALEVADEYIAEETDGPWRVGFFCGICCDDERERFKS